MQIVCFCLKFDKTIIWIWQNERWIWMKMSKWPLCWGNLSCEKWNRIDSECRISDFIRIGRWWKSAVNWIREKIRLQFGCQWRAFAPLNLDSIRKREKKTETNAKMRSLARPAVELAATRCRHSLEICSTSACTFIYYPILFLRRLVSPCRCRSTRLTCVCVHTRCTYCRVRVCTKYI